MDDYNADQAERDWRSLLNVERTEYGARVDRHWTDARDYAERIARLPKNPNPYSPMLDAKK